MLDFYAFMFDKPTPLDNIHHYIRRMMYVHIIMYVGTLHTLQHAIQTFLANCMQRIS